MSLETTRISCFLISRDLVMHLMQFSPQPPQPLDSEGNKEAFMAVIMILLERLRLLFMP